MIAAVENAVLARLEAAGVSGVLGYQWATAESSPYAWEDLFKDTISSVRCPAVWTGFTGFQNVMVSETGMIHVIGATFALVVASKNLRNEVATRHGVGEGEVGSYQLLMDAIGLLANHDVGLDIQPLKFGAAREVSRTPAMSKARMSVFAVEYRTDLWVSPADLEAETAAQVTPFEDFSVAWDVPPIGNVQPPLPAAEADARDLNPLPQEESQ